MHLSTLLRAAALLALGAAPWPGLAQTPSPSRLSYYAGVGGMVGYYQVSAARTSQMLAPELLGGVRLSPRLALEAGLAIYHSRLDHSGTGTYQLMDAAGNISYYPAIFRSVYQERTQALKLALRYTLLRPARRLQLDALLGAALLHTDAYGYNNTLDQATREVVRGQYYTRYDLTGGSLLLGPSLRYQVGPHVELASEYVASFAPGGRVPAGVSRLSGLLALSARYRFGGRP